jgi:hypothetical protein
MTGRFRGALTVLIWGELTQLLRQVRAYPTVTIPGAVSRSTTRYRVPRSHRGKRKPGERPPAPRPNNGLTTRPHLWGATPCIDDRASPRLGQPMA